MKILHVTPHLGGGVGKAHAAIAAALPTDVQQTFLLLEAPRDRRHADALLDGGTAVVIARDLDDVTRHTAAADIVQFEFWNHPRLFECLARANFPALRSIFWSHISGLFRPLIPPGLLAAADRFVFTTEASLTLPGVGGARVSVVNSGFGFERPAPRPARETPRIAYLGTVDPVKMHPGFFDAIDALEDDCQVSIWGAPSIRALAAALNMQNAHRLRLRGQTDRPQDALAQADLFFYPLNPEHYGTAENALVEAMSLGVVPVVLDNPAEAAIVRHGETGLVARSIEECPALLRTLLHDKPLRERLSANAAAHIAATRTPARSAEAFIALWRDMLAQAPRRPDFAAAIGATPADWFLATQGEAWSPSPAADIAAAKGTLSHFKQVFEGDASLERLHATS
jgi:glycosyltransferase involved in cell wall biosynthesis